MDILIWVIFFGIGVFVGWKARDKFNIRVEKK
jgi:hypothetical protein